MENNEQESCSQGGELQFNQETSPTQVREPERLTQWDCYGPVITVIFHLHFE